MTPQPVSSTQNNHSVDELITNIMNLIAKLKSQMGSVPMGLLICLCVAHCCNDTLQAVITALYPMLKSELCLSFAEIGLVTLVYQIAASIFQPVVGLVFDKHPKPWSLWMGMAFTTSGIAMLAFVNSLLMLLITVAMVGLGSSVMHPEASRIASVCSGGKRGLAQSVFQVGGNFGSSIGSLLVSLIVAHHGRRWVLVFLAISVIAFIVMGRIVSWFRLYIKEQKRIAACQSISKPMPFTKGRTAVVVAILMVLIISKYIYMACMTSYYTFYAIEVFGVSVSTSQLLLFIFVGSTAVGTLVGGPFGDRYGRKVVIWASILGAAPFALLLPHVSLVWAVVSSFAAGFMLSSAFPAILLYSQELLPNHLGLVSGLFFGFAFGIGGIASAVIGNFADTYGIEAVFRFCSYSPLVGIVAIFLPDLKKV